jgi:hypothetical protein
MQRFTTTIICTWMLFFHLNVFGDEKLVERVTNEISLTLSRTNASIRPPMRSRSSVSVESNRPEANAAPFASEFSAANGNLRLISTDSAQTLNLKKAKPKEAKRDAGVMIAGIRSSDSTAVVKNEKYAFTIGCTSDTDGWVLLNYGSTDSDIQDKLNERYEECKQPAKWIYTLDGMRYISTIFEPGTFSLLDSDQKAPTGPVVIKFTRQMRGNANVILECAYTFDPASGWLPIEWTEKANSKEFSRSLVASQRPTLSDGKYETDTVITLYSDKEKVRITRKIKYTVEAVDSIPASEFTLSGFDLPEIADTATQKSWSYSWIFAIAGICFLIMVVLRILSWRMRKHARI